MARFESAGTWFDPELARQREAKHTIKIDVYFSAPDVPAELRRIYDRYNRKGVLVDQAMQELQEYHDAIHKLLNWHRATNPGRRALRDTFLGLELQRAVLNEATTPTLVRSVLEEETTDLRRGEAEIIVRRGR